MPEIPQAPEAGIRRGVASWLCPGGVPLLVWPFMAVLALLLGIAYWAPAVALSRGRDPLLTMLLGLGLVVTVSTSGLIVGVHWSYILIATGCSALLLLIARALGTLDRGERFWAVHAVTLIGCLQTFGGIDARTTAEHQRGIELRRAGKLEEAIECQRAVLRAVPEHAEAHRELGNALGRLGRNAEAVTHFETAIRLKPTYHEAHDDLGVTLRDLGRLDEALQHHRRAVELAPDCANARRNLDETLGRLGKPDAELKRAQSHK